VKKIIFFQSILQFFAVFANAQHPCKYTIAGTIRPFSDSDVVQYAEIFIENLHIKAISNENGYFEIRNLCTGNYVLEIDGNGFRHTHASIYLVSDTFIQLKLLALEEEMTKVTIEQKKTKPLIVSQQDLQLKESGKNLAEQLEKIPGMNSFRSGNNISKPMLQGLTGMRLPIFINGIKQHGQQWGLEHGAGANGVAFENIELISGASTLLFCTEATAGLVVLKNEFTPHNGETDLITGSGFESNGNQINIFGKILSNPAKKNALYFTNLSLRRGGNYSTPNFTLPNTGFAEAMLAAGIGKQLPGKIKNLDGTFYYIENGIYSGSHIGNVQDLLDRINANRPAAGKFSYAIGVPKQANLHAQIRYNNIKYKSFGKRIFGAAMQLDDRKEYDFHTSSKLGFPQFDVTLVSSNFQYGLERKLNQNSFLHYGLQCNLFNNRYGSYYFIPDFTAIQPAAYVLFEKINRKSKHSFAMRSELLFSKSDAQSGIIRIHEKRFNAGFAAAYSGEFYFRKSILKFDAGRHIRFPWMNELYSQGVHHGAASFEIGNRNLKTEIGWKAGLTWIYNYRKHNFFTQIYSNYFQHFINLEPDTAPVLTVRGAFPAYIYKQFNCFFAGTELVWNYKINTALELKLAQSFLFCRNTDLHLYPAYIPPSKSFISFRYSFKKMALQLQAEHVYKQSFYTAGTDYLPPPEAYTLVGFNLTLKDIMRKQNMQIILGADNLLNVKYRNYLDRFRYFTDMPGRNFYFRMVWNFHHHNEK
jgi:iron complex outermembrane receptor protein